MKEQPFFVNLDTSFVDIEALVRYLRRRRFVGSIKLSFTGYNAEISFTESEKLRVTENDIVAGQMTSGEKAYKNIVTRANEPGGVVNVIQMVRETPQTAAAEPAVSAMTHAKTNGNGTNGDHAATAVKFGSAMPMTDFGTPVQLRGFPFPLTNNVEEKARASRHITDNHDSLAEVTGELLATIDSALERAGLDFSAAFEKACRDVAVDHPVMDPDSAMFTYADRTVRIADAADRSEIPEALGETLSRIFDRLHASEKLGKVYRFTTQKVRVLLQNRGEQFDRLSLTPHIERALGI